MAASSDSRLDRAAEIAERFNPVCVMARLSEERGQEAIAAVLRYGSLASTVVMALGLAVMLFRGTEASLPPYHRIRLAQLFPRLIRFDAAAVTECGILLLLLTPIFRIIVAASAFALERDFKYVAVSLGVLAVVLVSIGFAVG